MAAYIRNRVLALLLALPLALATQAPVAAQEVGSAGRLTGQVLNGESGAPLPGAHIAVETTSRSVMAGVEGRYQLDGLPEGTVTVTVNLLGFAPKTVTDVEIEGDRTVRLDLLLERQVIDVEGLTVTARKERGSVVSVLNEQRLAPGLLNGLSAERISRSPDGNAAAAVRRVSGVTVQDGKHVFVRGLGERYTTSSLNGARIPSPDPERKTVPLDLFPAGILQAVSTSKTFTPDQPGDFAGGSVDLRTPDFPAQQIYSFSMSTGYQPGVTGRSILRAPTEGGEWLALGRDARTIPAPAQNFSGTVTRGPEVNQVVNSFRNAWTVNEESGRLPTSMSGSLGGSATLAGATVGYLGSLTYSTSDEVKLDQRRARVGTGETEIDRYDGEEGASSVLWGGLVKVSALFGNHTQLHLTNNFNRSSDNQARRETGTDENTRSHVRIDQLTYVERAVRSHQLSAEHQLGPRHRLDWSLSRSTVNRAEPDRSEFVTWLDPEEPIWFKDFEGAVRSFATVDEGSLEGSAEYALSLGNDPFRPHRLRLGLLQRSTDRDAWSDAFRIQPFHWSPNDPRWAQPPEQFFDGRFAGPGDDHFILSRELAGGSYDASDWLYAGFLMAEASPTERIQVVGGARVEGYRLDLNAENQLGQGFSVSKDYFDLLPSLSARIRMSETHQLRLAATRTLARPEYREIAPIAYREVLGGEQVIGNVELERTLIHNLDFRWEWYPEPGEVISFGVFGKWFDNPIEQRFLARSGTNTRTFENADSATNYGAELEVDAGLHRLHPGLEPFSVFTNVTVMRSRVRTGREGDADRAMVGQAPYVANAGVTYAESDDGLSASLLFNVVGKRIMNARASGSQVRNVVERPRNLLDLSIRFPLPGNASGKLDLKNVLDAPHEVVQGPIVREFHHSGRSLSAGVSWSW